MKVAAITYTDALSGAGIAALRIQRAVSSHGVESKLHVLRKRTDAPDVEEIGDRWTRRAQALRARLSQAIFSISVGRPDVMLSANLFPTGIDRRLAGLDADLLHLHWVGAEMIKIEELGRLARPVVWTLHDEWFYEGIDHYRSLDGIVEAGSPATSPAGGVLDRSVRSRKAIAWERLDPFVVAPSRWLAENVRLSGLVPPDRIRVIPNPIPTETYRPIDRALARQTLGLPQDHKVIGFGAVRADMDPRKGYALLIQALEHLAAGTSTPMTLIVFGAHRGSDDLPFAAHFSGTIAADADLARLYAAMDVFVCPSLQENLPNTVGEAMACGIPCAAFRVGGIPDLIQHGVNGYLARPFEAEDLARGILACLAESEAMGRAGRAIAEAALDPFRCASMYAAVYEDAIRRGNQP
jgi:glycosyltransferase involved in cell wall biosynthesis